VRRARRLRIRQEVQHVHEQHGVEGRRAKRRPRRLGPEHRQLRTSGAQVGEHRRRDVDADDLDAAAGQGDGDPAGTDADLEQPGRRADGAQRPHKPGRDVGVRRIRNRTRGVVAVRDPVEALGVGARHERRKQSARGARVQGCARGATGAA
jgi:hypothetical protein